MSRPRQPVNENESRRPTSRTRASQPSSRAGSATRNSRSQSQEPTSPTLVPFPGLINDMPVELSLQVIELLLTNDPRPSIMLLRLSLVNRRTRSLLNAQAVRIIGAFASHTVTELASTVQTHKYRGVRFWTAFHRWSGQKGIFRNPQMAQKYTFMFVDAFIEAYDAWDVDNLVRSNLKRFVISLMRIHVHEHVNPQPHSGHWTVQLSQLTTNYNTSINYGFPPWARLLPGYRYDRMVRNTPGCLGVSVQHPVSTTVSDLNLLTSVEVGNDVYDNGHQDEETVMTAFNLPHLPPGFAYRSSYAQAIQTLADTAGKLADWRQLNSSCAPGERGALEARRPDFKVALTAIALESLEIF